MENKKEMTVLEFIEKYQELNSEKIKEELLKKVIRRTYCPIQEKRLVLQVMLDSSKIDDGTIEYLDLIVSRISYTVSLIILYTNLKLDVDDDTKEVQIHEIYDGLVKNDILEKICEQLGEKEVSELSTINELLIQNYYNLHNSPYAVVSHFANKLGQKIGIAAGYALEQLDSILDDKESFVNILNKIKPKN
jgi:hypothetical protein